MIGSGGVVVMNENYRPLEQHVEHALLARATGVAPIFHLGNDV
jgi:hypothetical protein